jgi:hypothetical protein
MPRLDGHKKDQEKKAQAAEDKTGRSCCSRAPHRFLLD